MDWGAVFVATILAAAIATFIMAFVANVPYAQAPGMGLNAMFTFTVCIGMGIPWEQALAVVFICGIINIIITVTRIRKMIIYAIPKSLQYAISGGIGLFIAYIGLLGGHLLTFTPDGAADAAGNYSKVIPALVDFTKPGFTADSHRTCYHRRIDAPEGQRGDPHRHHSYYTYRHTDGRDAIA